MILLCCLLYESLSLLTLYQINNVFSSLSRLILAIISIVLVVVVASIFERGEHIDIYISYLLFACIALTS